MKKIKILSLFLATSCSLFLICNTSKFCSAVSFENSSNDINTNSNNSNYKIKKEKSENRCEDFIIKPIAENDYNSQTFNNIFFNNLENDEMDSEYYENIKKKINNEKVVFLKIKNANELRNELNLNIENYIKITPEQINTDNNSIILSNCKNYLKVLDFKIINTNKYTKKIYKSGNYNGIKYDILKKGDLITNVNGKNIDKKNVYELEQCKKEIQHSKTLEIEFLRPKKNKNLIIEDSDNFEDSSLENKIVKYEKMKCVIQENNDNLNECNPNFHIELILNDQQNNIDTNSININPINLLYIKFKKGLNFDDIALLKKRMQEFLFNDEFYSSQIGEILIDLRDCKGGLFGAVQQFAENFTPAGTPITTVNYLQSCLYNYFNVKSNNENPIFYDSISKKPLKHVNILINKNTTESALHLAYILKKITNATIFGISPNNLQIEWELVNLKGKKTNNCCVIFPKIAYKTGKELEFEYFEPKIIPDYETENLEIVKKTLFRKMIEILKGTIVDKNFMKELYKKTYTKIKNEENENLEYKVKILEDKKINSQSNNNNLLYDYLTPIEKENFSNYMNIENLLATLKNHSMKTLNLNELKNLNFNEKLYIYSFLLLKQAILQKQIKLNFENKKSLSLNDIFTKNDLNFLKLAFENLNPVDLLAQQRDYNLIHKIDSSFVDFNNPKYHIFYMLNHTIKNESAKNSCCGSANSFKKIIKRYNSDSAILKNQKFKTLQNLLNKIYENELKPTWLVNQNLDDSKNDDLDLNENYDNITQNIKKQLELLKKLQNKKSKKFKNTINDYSEINQLTKELENITKNTYEKKDFVVQNKSFK